MNSNYILFDGEQFRKDVADKCMTLSEASRRIGRSDGFLQKKITAGYMSRADTKAIQFELGIVVNEIKPEDNTATNEKKTEITPIEKAVVRDEIETACKALENAVSEICTALRKISL